VPTQRLGCYRDNSAIFSLSLSLYGRLHSVLPWCIKTIYGDRKFITIEKSLYPFCRSRAPLRTKCKTNRQCTARTGTGRACATRGRARAHKVLRVSALIIQIMAPELSLPLSRVLSDKLSEVHQDLRGQIFFAYRRFCKVEHARGVAGVAMCRASSLFFLFIFLGWRIPNLISGLSGWSISK